MFTTNKNITSKLICDFSMQVERAERVPMRSGVLLCTPHCVYIINKI